MNIESHIAAISRVVSDKLGLHFPENRSRDLISGLQSAARELGFETDENTFISLLTGHKLSKKQLDIIAEQLTIGETYFFREKQTLSAFRDMIIPTLVKEREHTTRSIRIWSAGCCSGEEPYTLAIIVSEIIPNIKSWNITILATDINRRFLAKATQGRYTPWSFRETPPETRQKYFTSTGKEFEISQDIRDMVVFQPLNLVEDPFPSARNNTNDMDVIFCRNVLMYFAPETIRAVGEKFYRCLNDQGWFIPSQVELSDELFHLFAKVNFKNSFLYLKTAKPADSRPKPHVGVSKRSPAVGIRLQKTETTDWKLTVHARKPAGVTKAPLPVPKDNPLELTRNYANQGDLANALLWSEKLVTADPGNPEGYYLQGMILFEQGNLDRAEMQLKRALYLDPNHLLAHFQMVTVCLGAGKEKQARKHKENVMDLLQRFGDEDLIPGAEGLTVAHLRGLLQPINTS